ncbi:MAG: hypothetical protein KDN18_04245 [Verrucomicrobiae bacterium]|nr:hypothetical protein [Verrucomicrobiae bacterium]
MWYLLGKGGIQVILLCASSWICAQETAKLENPGQQAEWRADRADPRLVPAAFGIWTDRGGSSWSVEAGGNIGRIGSTMVNSGLALLVNEEKFTPYQPMMTPDGKELVLQGMPLDSLPGLRVQRRIRLIDEPGGLRYAELFYNGAAESVTVSVGLVTNFSGNFKTFLSDRGRSEPLLLSETESGVIVMPGASQSSRAFLFTLADPASVEKPSISSQNRYGLTFRYRLDLAPGETRAVVHHVSQVVIPQNFDRRTMLELSRPFALAGLRGTFAPDWKDLVINAPEPAGISAKSVFQQWRNSIPIPPAPATDLLMIGENTRLPGKIEGGSVALASPYGLAEFPMETISAIQGGKRRADGKSRLFLRDGQVFSGTVSIPDFGFRPVDGSILELSPETLDWLISSGRSEQEGWPVETLAMIETHDGDRIRILSPESIDLVLITPWGRLPLSLDSLLWLRPDVSGLGWSAELKDGTKCTGLFATESIKVTGTDLGEVLLPQDRLRHVLTPASLVDRPIPDTPESGALIRLQAEQRLIGFLSHTTLPVISEGVLLEVPITELRRVTRLEGGSETATMPALAPPSFSFERWDGGVISGTFALDLVAVQVAGRTWQIPLSDLAGLELAPPALSAETLSKIEALILRLGSPDWKTRESATRELGAFGYLARPVLQRELGVTGDPEITRRLERVLAGLN